VQDMISIQDPVTSRPAWRRRRRLPLSAILAWSLAAVALSWLLASAIIGLTSAA
jgi:hypothetical protein